MHLLIVVELYISLSAEKFGPEHRPIVEFAVENFHKIKHRKAKLGSLNVNDVNLGNGMTDQQSSAPQTIDADAGHGRKKLKNIKRKKGLAKSSKESAPTEGAIEKLGEHGERSNAEEGMNTSGKKAGKQKTSASRKGTDSPAKSKPGKSVPMNSHKKGTESQKKSKNPERVSINFYSLFLAC